MGDMTIGPNDHEDDIEDDEEFVEDDDDFFEFDADLDDPLDFDDGDGDFPDERG